MTTPNNTVAGLAEKLQALTDEMNAAADHAQAHGGNLSWRYPREWATTLSGIASPAPSAPVVDDAIKAAAMRCARRAYGFWRGGDNGSWEALAYFDGGYVARERDASMYEGEIRAALSGVSAPVGVEGDDPDPMDIYKAFATGVNFAQGDSLSEATVSLLAEAVEVGTLCSGAAREWLDAGQTATADALSKAALMISRLARALTPPAAAPRAECPHRNQMWAGNMRWGTCQDCGAPLGEPRPTPTEDNATPAAAAEREALSLLRELRESNALSPYWQGRADPVLERATQPEAHGVEGMVLVPREPTEAMLSAGYGAGTERVPGPLDMRRWKQVEAIRRAELAASKLRMEPKNMADIVQSAIECLCENGFQSCTHGLIRVREYLTALSGGEVG